MYKCTLIKTGIRQIVSNSQLKNLSNTRVIAVTPELYQAAKLVLKTFHRRTGLSMSEEYALDRLNEAVSKTKGKE